MLTSARWASLRTIATFGLSAVLVGSGCGGDGLPRQAVKGQVSVDGKPLKSGLITFVPNGPDIPTQGGAAIVDGKFSLEKSVGLVPGKYKVVVSSGEGTPEKKVDSINDMPGMPPVPAKEVIPPEFGSASILTADVTDSGPNEFSYTIVSKGKGK